MLIIAIPKSASTSLLHTLGEVHDLKSEQDFNSVKDNPIPSDYRLLGKYHSDCRNLISKTINKWEKAGKFYKQHIPPTRSNLKLLDCTKKVILLREPQEIILAYRRADKKGLHETRVEFKGCLTKEDWIYKAKEIGLYQELSSFYNGWMNVSSEKYIIHFEDLISTEKEIIKTVSEYFNLPVTERTFDDLELKKIRYSRYNLIQEYVRKFKKRLRNFTELNNDA